MGTVTQKIAAKYILKVADGVGVKAEELPKPAYVGVFLSPSENSKLLAHAKFTLKNPEDIKDHEERKRVEEALKAELATCAHHMTIISPTRKDFLQGMQEILDKDLLGKEFELTTRLVRSGTVTDKKPEASGEIEAAVVDEIEAVLVDEVPELPYYNDSPKHITLSREKPGIKPFHAGKVNSNERGIPEVKVKGRVGFFYGVGDNGTACFSVEECKRQAK